jgi:hypothetical protein
MAQRIVLSDDLDGSEATQTLHYTVDGQEYEIDLSEENVQRFEETAGGEVASEDGMTSRRSARGLRHRAWTSVQGVV